MAGKKSHVRVRPRRPKKAAPAVKSKPQDDALTALARELVDELEKTELRRWDGWMDQMLQ